MQFDFAMSRGGFPQRHNHLFVVVTRSARFAGDDRIGFVVRVAANIDDLLARSPRATLAEFQRQRGILHDGSAMKHHAINRRLIGGETENDLHGSVRRLEQQRPGGRCRKWKCSRE